MTGPITTSLGAVAQSCLSQLSGQIDSLPAELWIKPVGGWPAWQHVVHAISTVDLFIPGEPVEPPAGLSAEVLELEIQGSNAPAQALIAGYLGAVRDRLDVLVRSIEDGALTGENLKLAEIGLPFNLAMSLAGLATHASYHVGHIDALLRDHGLEGVF
jgi:hypothetical protein